MSGFQFNVRVHSSDVAREMARNPETAVLVLESFALLAPLSLANHVSKIKEEPAAVAAFYQRFADMIEGEI